MIAVPQDIFALNAKDSWTKNLPKLLLLGAVLALLVYNMEREALSLSRSEPFSQLKKGVTQIQGMMMYPGYDGVCCGVYSCNAEPDESMFVREGFCLTPNENATGCRCKEWDVTVRPISHPQNR